MRPEGVGERESIELQQCRKGIWGATFGAVQSKLHRFIKRVRNSQKVNNKAQGAKIPICPMSPKFNKHFMFEIHLCPICPICPHTRIKVTYWTYWPSKCMSNIKCPYHMYFDRKMFIELRGTSRAGILGQEELAKSVKARLCTLSISSNLRLFRPFLLTLFDAPFRLFTFPKHLQTRLWKDRWNRARKSSKKARIPFPLRFVNFDAHFLPPNKVRMLGKTTISRTRTRSINIFPKFNTFMFEVH